ncbi:MAG: alpha/beta hydrolase [Pseudomonadota bacterium]|nr:alpha/beta hydrolase [Pseudomonadota bacterium]
MADQPHSRPALDPQCQAVVDAARNAGGSAFQQPDFRAVRAGYNRTTEVYAPPTPELARVEDMQIPADEMNPAIPIRIYRPRNAATPSPVVVFFHGGGWAVGDLESHDAVCRTIAARTDVVVVAVDYRLAPEHPFPAAVEDCERATRFVHQSAADLGLDGSRMALCGDSAGANLSTITARRLRDGNGPGIALQVLIYPGADFTATGGSLDENGTGYILTKASIEMFRGWYLPDPATWAHPDASPIKAESLAGLPPALVLIAGYDPLRDEGVAYTQAMRDAGVAVEMIEYPTMLHGFVRMGRLVNMASVALDDVAQAIRAALRS